MQSLLNIEPCSKSRSRIPRDMWEQTVDSAKIRHVVTPCKEDRKSNRAPLDEDEFFLRSPSEIAGVEGESTVQVLFERPEKRKFRLRPRRTKHLDPYSNQLCTETKETDREGSYCFLPIQPKKKRPFHPFSNDLVFTDFQQETSTTHLISEVNDRSTGRRILESPVALRSRRSGPTHLPPLLYNSPSPSYSQKSAQLSPPPPPSHLKNQKFTQLSPPPPPGLRPKNVLPLPRSYDYKELSAAGAFFGIGD